ncbi:oxidoreductase [Cohnella candidum]|uniref:Oxidoreductase n=1 Tax=Cohnella candidum TaxID=2674991 RepID=A0A3G3JYT6_9BACL|nr:oxidoreductase [Cohnella candidum]AYQ73017.1 oxidoreductase [Cohnella candidum]
MKKLNVGIAGFGLSGQIFHAPIIRSIEGIEIVKVFSSNAQKVKQHLPDADVVSAFDDLLSDNAIDLVVITTPNDTHYDFAKRSLIAGKHVVVEKPFVITSEEARDLMETAALQNRVLSVYQNRRWDNDFLTVKRTVDSGVLGDIALYEAHYDRYRPEVTDRWREKEGPGSGMLYDLGAHLIDQALYLFGKPASVYADVFPQRIDSKVDDYFHIVLTYGKMRAILHSGSLVSKHGPRFQLHGSQGSFTKYGLDSQEDMLRQGGTPGKADWGKDREEDYGEITHMINGRMITEKVETLSGCYECYYQGIYDAIMYNAPAPVRAEEALITIKVIELAMRSSVEKRTLPFE